MHGWQCRAPRAWKLWPQPLHPEKRKLDIQSLDLHINTILAEFFTPSKLMKKKHNDFDVLIQSLLNFWGPIETPHQPLKQPGRLPENCAKALAMARAGKTCRHLEREQSCLRVGMPWHRAPWISTQKMNVKKENGYAAQRVGFHFFNTSYASERFWRKTLTCVGQQTCMGFNVYPGRGLDVAFSVQV